MPDGNSNITAATPRKRRQYSPVATHPKDPDYASRKGDNVTALPRRLTDDRELIKRMQSLRQEADRRRTPWTDQWEEVYDYCLPGRDGFYDRPGTAQRRTDHVFDMTAVSGLPRFASRIQLGYFPPAGRNFLLVPGPFAKPLDWSLEQECDKVTNIAHEMLRNSNFASELHEGLIDLAIGTMNQRIDPGPFPGDLVTTSVPATQVSLLSGPGDTIGGWFRCRYAQVIRDLMQEFPNAEWPIEYRRPGSNALSEKVDVIEACIRDTKSWHEEKWDCVTYIAAGPELKLWHKEYTGLGSCPWTTTRWTKAAGDVWGRGPLLSVMPAIRTVNYVVRLVLENAEMAVAGLYVYDDDNVFDPDNIVIAPGVFIPRAPGSKVDALETTSRFDVSQIVLGDERANIRKGLFIDEYERDAKTPLSAFEVQQRSADIAKDQSSVAGRLKTEHLDRTVQRVVWIAKQQGLVRKDFPPIDGKQVRLMATGPLLRSQQQADIQNFVQFVQILNATYGPQASQIALNPGETVDWLSDQFGVDRRILNSPQQIAEALAGAKQMAEEMTNGGETPEMLKVLAQTAPR